MRKNEKRKGDNCTKYAARKYVIPNDKYFTPTELASNLITKTFLVLQKEGVNINELEIIEPSAGSGAFSSQIKGCVAYDLFPENNKNIIKADYLKLNLAFKQNRLIIGNPPFGRASMVARAFIKQSNKIAGYTGFILPITFLRNKLDLNIIYSEELHQTIFTNGKNPNDPDYTEKIVNVCYIICKHIESIKYIKYNLNAVKVFEIRKQDKNYIPNKNEYDFKMLRWGSGQDFGELLTNKQQSHHSYRMFAYIKVINKSLYKIIQNTLINFKSDYLLKYIKNNNYTTGACSFSLAEVYKYILEHIPELK